ncbi:DUF7573 domain-containing protein [Halocatena pleomorpha]|uniref:DUF7573 domain-containing protein n=1 Tax=Halocatena pleomorpha TaxID=1785090 RepID=A0A3P3R5J9_9EURY|nr:hypothetical protein [Halocatena pleomorpha]RRJ28634.1 hypothetical protein EIK79_15200 [Halocatena pleomorpha]
MKDRSLDEFQNEKPQGDAATTVPKTTPTMDWTPEGAACSDCGENVHRRWRDADGNGRLVCVSCKRWA